MRRLLLILLFSWMSVSAAVEIPRSMLSGRSGLLAQGLGNSCFSFDLPADTLPCNPAFIAKNRDPRFRAQLFFGHNVGYLKEAEAAARGNAGPEIIDRILGRESASELEASVEFGYSRPTFGFSVTPFHLNYFAHFRNPALPESVLYAAQEESVQIQFGSYLSQDLYWGVQLKGLHRKYVASRFFLTDALAEGGGSLFRMRDQKIFYFEPSILFSPEGKSWNPEVSLSLSNLGTEDHADLEVPMLPQAHLSASIRNELGLGVWGLGVDYSWDNRVTEVIEPLTLGSFYQLGILTLFGSVSQNSYGLGMKILSGSFDLGFVSATDVMKNGFGERTSSERISVLLGIEI